MVTKNDRNVDKKYITIQTSKKYNFFVDFLQLMVVRYKKWLVNL